MGVAPEHPAEARQVGAREHRQPLARRLEVDHDADGDEVEDARDRGGEGHGRVRDAECLGHDERRGAHDGRNELAAHRRRRLDARGEGRAVAGAHHQRDREGAGRHRVGDGTPVHGAEEAARDHRDLARAAARPAGDRQRGVGEESEEAAVSHDAAEDNEHVDEGRRDERRNAEDAARREHLPVHELHEALAAVEEKTRQPGPGERVDDEGER